MKNLIIATRKSKLALWQANFIKDELNKHYVNMNISIKECSTKGDKILDTPLAKIGGKGLFTKELEIALLQKQAHIAVHSLKDVPTKLSEEFNLTTFTQRYDASDALLSNKYKTIQNLPNKAIIGTTSLRRKMLLKILRPDLIIKDLRGNINTRIKKLQDNEYDAIILATTGIQKMNMQNEVKYFTPLDQNIMIPSMGQATLCIQTLNDKSIIDIVSILNDKNSYIESTIERDFVDTLDGGCQVPIGVKATILDKQNINIKAIVGLPNGKEYIKDNINIKIDQYKQAGVNLANSFIKKGAKDLLKRAFEIGFD
jgi:hydroxymethylbilane synthase